MTGGAGHFVELAREGGHGDWRLQFRGEVEGKAQVLVQQIGHKAGFETAIEGAQRELIGELPTGARADANDIRHRFDIRASFYSHYKGLGDRGSDSANEHIVD